MIEKIFERNGLGALSDFKNKEWRELFSFLVKEQELFLLKEKEFRSTEYKWIRDPLHTWSRVWEYPYVYYNIKKELLRVKEAGNFRILDYGSGVTFFPFLFPKLGTEIYCVDVDKICKTDLLKAKTALNIEEDKFYVNIIQETLPYNQGSFDIIYCISVLEHIENWEKTVDEIYRVLKKDGLFILTFDLDMLGNLELGIAQYKKLMIKLKSIFRNEYEEFTIHPKDILFSNNSIYKFLVPEGINLFKYYLEQIFRLARFRKPRKKTPFLLAVKGLCLRK